jgi:hypothetical protein|tara:strand:+ start:1955 stop:3295 length:1341 start_codon:yes stop_codon:yes gene_type:complete
MAELENNLESTEVEVSEEKQPTDGAQKGDAKPVKQGSSDAEKIESGKAEVVKPEENPVDKAVDAQKKAENVKPVSGDAHQKNAGKGDSQPKLAKVSEEEESKDVVKATKMESIKAIVNNMKEMTKEELQTRFSSISEEEVDETLTKAEVARKIVESLKSMDEEAVSDIAEKWSKEEEEEEEVKEEIVDEETSAELEANLVEIEVEDDLSKISEALDISEENQEKAKTIFKAAVSSKVEEIKESLENQYSEELKSSVEKVKADLAEGVDKYLSYVAEEWTKENELAIERGLRAEMTENFIDGLKTLFVEHYVDVPEDKYNVIDELANRLDEMEQKLDGEVSKNIDITEELDALKRSNVVKTAGNSLSESQKEKLESLSNGVDFKDEADFAEKIAEIAEAYFPSDVDKLVEDTIVEEGTGEISEEKEPVLAPDMQQYTQAITKLNPLG